jgi:hypothetical protein
MDREAAHNRPPAAGPIPAGPITYAETGSSQTPAHSYACEGRQYKETAANSQELIGIDLCWQAHRHTLTSHQGCQGLANTIDLAQLAAVGCGIHLTSAVHKWQGEYSVEM